MKKWIAPFVIALILAMAGCQGQEATATKAEEDHFRNPPKTPPPEAKPGGMPPAAVANPGK